MTFKEAYESGRKFRRKAHSCWLIVNENGHIMESTGNYFKNIYGYSIVADDWEIEGEKLEFTAAQIEDSFRTYLEGDFEEFIRSLGFKEKGK